LVFHSVYIILFDWLRQWLFSELLASVVKVTRLIDFQHLLTFRGIRLRDFEKRLASLSVIRRGFFEVS